MGPWPWVVSEERTPLDVRTLTDTQLSILARYRGFVAANTSPGKPEFRYALTGLREVFDELIKRQTKRYRLSR